MKKTIFIVAFAAFFAACNTNPKTADNNNQGLSMADTAGLHEFQMFKEQQRIEQQQLIQTEPVNDNRMDAYAGTAPSNNVRTVYQEERVVSRPAPRRVYTTHRTSSARTSRSRSGGYSGSNNSYGSVASTPVPARKRGWSKAAKGTVIGAGSGAVLGAIVSKNKGKGAIIGGILGAGAGYAIGRGQDKRDGRY